MKKNFVLALGLLVCLLSVTECKHEPITSTDPGTPPGPPLGGSCDPDSVYFQNQILPILVSNCTESGCHNPADHEEGIVLNSYASVISTVKHVTSNDWGKNKLIKSLESSDSEDRMPQGKPPLSTDEINLIKIWVNQGALNNQCDELSGGCDTIGGAKYATFIQPLMQSRCKGCHSGANPQGGIKLTNYTEIQALALDGRLYGSVTRSSSWMPSGGSKLDDCTLVKIKTWIDAGAPEN